MSDSQYQGSQAFNQSFLANEFVTRNTGALNVTKALVNLRGLAAGIGLTINLTYTAGTSGLLGLPSNWGFGLSFVVPGASLTSQGKTSVIDPDWTDISGYQSGLRYVNDHGIKFQSIVPPQPLPSGQPGTYSYTLTYNDGACDYYDATGKLVEHDDLFGNHINYFYTDQFSGVFNNRLDHIVDSFGQTVTFGYASNAIVITSPDGSQTTINFSAQGVQSVEDALGNLTAFTYMAVAGQTVVATIEYPTGLTTQLGYTTLAYLSSSGAQAAFPAVSDHYHLDADRNVLDHTGYTFGTDSGSNTFTGFSAGYQMSSGADSLMDSNNTLYQYDVLVSKFDASGALLAASRVYYNYLHLPTREEHYLISSTATVSNGYRALYSYQINPDYHARTTNYTQPVLTQQFVYASEAGDYLPLRQSTTTYDAYGRVLTSEEFLFDPPSQAYVSQMATTNAYVPATWGGEMPQNEIYVDNVTGFQRQVAYTLTPDQKNIASSTVLYRDNAQAVWSPWKTKAFAYDVNGRVVSTTLSWSPGSTPPPGSITSTTSTNAYTFNQATRAYSIASTNALGNTTTRTYDIGVVTGPMIQAVTPLGEMVTYAYDALGRITQQTDALGHVTATAYALAANGGVNSVTATGPAGYVVAYIFDALGRETTTMDNGDPTKSGGPTNRTLRQAAYDALGHISKITDEIGLVTTSRFDSLNRQVQSTDPLGNISTVTFNDAAGTIALAVNNALRRMTQLDGLGRSVSTTIYPDSSDPSITYRQLHQVSYDGFGLVTGAQFSSVPASGSPQVLYQSAFTHNVEAKVISEHYVGSNGRQATVLRNTDYELFGNAVAYTKQTTYADGRAYTNTGSAPAFDAAGQLISITNQLQQAEHYSYDADGHLQTRTRFDGTLFNYSYDGNGHLLTMSWPGGSVNHSYLPNERVQSTSCNGAVLQYAYYLDGGAKTITYPDGRTQTYSVDSASRIVSSTDASGGATNIAFDQYGRIAQRQCGGDTVTYAYGTVNHVLGSYVGDTLTGASSFARQIQYDGFGQTSATDANNASGQSLLSARYTRDAAGRLMTLVLSSATSSDPSINLTRTPSYDGLNQLTGFVTTYAGGNPQDQQSFVYDGNFNVLTRTQNGSAQTYTYNIIDQLTIAGVVYDTNGRMTADGPNGCSYGYNALDQLTSAARAGGTPSISYAYYPDSALATTTVDENVLDFYYNGGAANAIAASTAASSDPNWTTFLLDTGSRRSAYETGQPPSYYFTSSESTSLLQQGSESPATLSYSAYGVVENVVSVDADKCFTWNQEYTDPVSNLVYLRTRYYNPALMRFMSMDNLTTDNRYAYCSGNPLNLVDPTGHMDTAEIVGLVAGAIVGIVATVVTGGAAGAAAAAIFGTESVAASVGATALAGAAGAVAGDATNAGITGQKFTAERALIDLASGAVGGAVGAGVGGYAGRVAMSTALAEGMSQRAITNIGLVCSGVAGGISGSAAASGVTSLAYGQPFFSANTALSMAIGAAAGVGGGFLTSGAYLGKINAKLIPVPLTEAELGLITPAHDNVGANLNEALLVMAPQPEADSSAAVFGRMPGGYQSSQTLDYQLGSQTLDTIAAHGAGNTMFVSVEYQQSLALSGEPNFVRPIRGSLFAKFLVDNPDLVGGLGGRLGGNNTPVKLMTCFGAFSNAQTIADALQRPVWGGYPEIDRYSFTNWKYFRPS